MQEGLEGHVPKQRLEIRTHSVAAQTPSTAMRETPKQGQTTGTRGDVQDEDITSPEKRLGGGVLGLSASKLMTPRLSCPLFFHVWCV